jgi:hypothetical protein
VLKLFGEDALKIMTQLNNNTYETGQLPTDFIEVTSMIALKKTPKPAKCSDYPGSALSQYSKDISEDIWEQD